jgi:hypothetical protein
MRGMSCAATPALPPAQTAGPFYLDRWPLDQDNGQTVNDEHPCTRHEMHSIYA